MSTQELERLEHLMRLLPAGQAELVYLEANASTWPRALGVHLDDLPPLLDGTPLSSSITGRRCRQGWREDAPALPGSAWEELTFLRLATQATPYGDPFEELDALRFDVEAQKLAYRN